MAKYSKILHVVIYHTMFLLVTSRVPPSPGDFSIFLPSQFRDDNLPASHIFLQSCGVPVFSSSVGLLKEIEGLLMGMYAPRNVAEMRQLEEKLRERLKDEFHDEEIDEGGNTREDRRRRKEASWMREIELGARRGEFNEVQGSTMKGRVFKRWSRVGGRLTVDDFPPLPAVSALSDPADNLFRVFSAPGDLPSLDGRTRGKPSVSSVWSRELDPSLVRELSFSSSSLQSEENEALRRQGLGLGSVEGLALKERLIRMALDHSAKVGILNVLEGVAVKFLSGREGNGEKGELKGVRGLSNWLESPLEEGAVDEFLRVAVSRRFGMTKDPRDEDWSALSMLVWLKRFFFALEKANIFKKDADLLRKYGVMTSILRGDASGFGDLLSEFKREGGREELEEEEEDDDEEAEWKDPVLFSRPFPVSTPAGRFLLSNIKSFAHLWPPTFSLASFRKFDMCFNAAALSFPAARLQFARRTRIDVENAHTYKDLKIPFLIDIAAFLPAVEDAIIKQIHARDFYYVPPGEGDSEVSEGGGGVEKDEFWPVFY